MTNRSNRDDEEKSFDSLIDDSEISPELRKELEEIISLEQELSDTDDASEAPVFEFDERNDHMEVWIVFKSELQAESLPDVEMVMEAFMEKGYDCNLEVEALQTAIDTVLMGKNRDFLVGLGTAPVHGKDGYLKWYVNEPESHAHHSDEEGHVDHRVRHYRVFVEKDEELVSVVPAKKGVDGLDVFGRKVASVAGKPIKFSVGNNIQYMPELGLALAAKNGVLTFEHSKLSIEEVLYIGGDVDKNVGMIDSEIDVWISGNVLNGFDILSKKSVFVQGNIEGANVTSEEGQIKVGGGIIGKKRANIKSAKGIICKYAQECHLISEGDIEVTDALLFCWVSGNERLIVSDGKHGVIMGGKIRIRKGIIANQIGSVNEPRTELKMGYDFSFEEELTKADLEFQALEDANEKLKTSIDEKLLDIEHLPKSGSLLHDFNRDLLALKKESLLLKIEMEKLKKYIVEMEKKALSDSESYIHIRKSIFPNTKIFMRGKMKSLESELTRMEITLNPKESTLDFRKGPK
jgi:uncharacterized protein (DUF342 family)